MSLKDHASEMAALYAEGRSMGEIARQFGCTRQRVHQLIQGTYTDAHYGRIHKDAHKRRTLEAFNRVLEGVSTADEEADAIGIKKTSLLNLFRRHGLYLPSTRPPSALHGTYYRYQEGCRCEECQEGRRAYWRKLRERGPRVHGTASAYHNYACRCPACRIAGSISNREERRRRRARERQLAQPLD